MAIAAVVVVACVFVARAQGVNEVEIAIFNEIQRLPNWSPRGWQVLAWCGSWPGIVVGAGLALYLGRVRMALALAWSGVVAWVLVVLLHALVSARAVDAALLVGSLHGPGVQHFDFPSLHVAIVAALAAAAAPYVTRAERYCSWVLVVAVAVTDLYQSTSLPLDVFAGAVLGWGVGTVLHLVLGAPGRRTAEPSVQVALRQVGLVPERVQRTVGHRLLRPQVYEVTCAEGERLQVKVVRRLHRSAGPSYKLRRMLASVAVVNEPALSTPRHEVAHEAYITLLAERAGVGTLPVLLASEIEHGPPFLIQRQVDGRALSSLSAEAVDDALLGEVWRNVRALGPARIAHHGLTASNLLVDGGGRIRITDFTFSRVGTPDGQNCQDVAEALVSLTSVVGVERAVDSALHALPRQLLHGALPHLQPLALHAKFRRQVPDRSTLGELRAMVAERLGSEVPPFRSPVRPATVAIVAAGVLAIYLLLPEFSSITQVRSVIADADKGWLAVTVASGMLAVVASSWTILGAARDRLPVGRTVAVQVAAAFTGRTTVAALGYYAINLAFLERLGLRRSDAVGVLVLNRAATVVVTGLATVIGLLVIRNAVPIGSVSIPWWAAVALGAGIVMAVGFVLTPFGRDRVVRRLTTMLGDLLAATRLTLRRPVRTVQLLGGETAFLALSAAGTVATLWALDAHFSVVAVVAVFMVASTIGQMLPTPGGLGAVEGGLVAGLTAIGIPPPTAIAAALVARVLTFWLPVVPGIVAFRLLQHHGVI
jgi:glycosyltransferase 2 family protein